MKVHHGGSFTSKGGSEYILDTSDNDKGKELFRYFDPFKGLDDILGQYAQDNIVEAVTHKDKVNEIIEDVEVDMKPFKYEMDKKESFVRRCDPIEAHFDVSEVDLDVINLDSFGSDLEDGVDTERRKILRELRKQNMSTNTAMYQFAFFISYNTLEKYLMKRIFIV
ncbi:hypothetical protein Tco_0947698 [Tanacetum coccineum]